jgi:hypothetical protein
MAESSSTEEKPSGLKIKLFSGKEDEDWFEWKLKFQGVLRSKKLLRHLTTEKPTEVEGSLERLAAIDKWKD